MECGVWCRNQYCYHCFKNYLHQDQHHLHVATCAENTLIQDINFFLCNKYIIRFCRIQLSLEVKWNIGLKSYSMKTNWYCNIQRIVQFQWWTSTDWIILMQFFWKQFVTCPLKPRFWLKYVGYISNEKPCILIWNFTFLKIKKIISNPISKFID